MTARNVILICVDQWRGDCLSAAGHPLVRTPYLDDLASRGVRFTTAYSPAPTCVPARMSLMTGLTPPTHRRVGYADGVRFDIKQTLPGIFREAGYQTQAIGKMHYWPERTRIGFDDVILHDGYLHFSRRRGRAVEEYDDYVPWLRAQAGQSARADYFDDGLNCNSVVAHPWDRAEELHPTNWIVSEMTRWLYRRDPDAPFFLYLSFHRPHPPYDPPAWAFDQYIGAPDYRPVRGDWLDDYAGWRDDSKADANVAVYPQDILNRARAGYFGNMTHIDTQLNRAKEILDEFGVWDDTVVCFTSDHGEMLGEHDFWRKAYPYEGSAHIPMILRGPGIVPRQVCDDIVGLEDVMPTLLEAAGLEVPEGVEGRSLLPSVSEERGVRAKAAPREFYFGEHSLFDRSMQWVRSPGYKYVWLSNDGTEQLFDMTNDPQELRNLAGDVECADVLARHREMLVDHLTGRPEGYVDNGRLVTGCAPRLVLPQD